MKAERLAAGVALTWVLALTLPARATLVDTTHFTESAWAFVTGGEVTGIAWAPDGSNRLFVARKGGVVAVIEDGALVATPFITAAPVYTNSECGLIGIAFHPDFATNGYVYFFQTVSATEQQIIRYTAVGNVGMARTVIVSGLPTAGQNHDGGALGVGPDGKLYWSIGDQGNGTGVNADLSSLAAKVGRANLDGTVPNDNPFFDGTGPNNDYIWARGFRNPFTFTWQPSTDLLWINVVGTGYEQVFAVTRGSHAGYNTYENTQPLVGYLQPLIKYRTNGTDSFTISSAVRASGVVTFTTTLRHRLRLGERVTVTGVADTSFNAGFYVAGTPADPNAAGATTFSVVQAGSDASSTGGMVTTLNQGGAILGGTFYDATAFPAEYRGNFFYGDFNSNRVLRAVVGPGTTVQSVDYFASNITSYIDAAVGPDGALYYVGHAGQIHRVRYNATQQAVIVSRSHLWFSEGSEGAVSVSLAIAPAADVEVVTLRSAGSSDLTLAAGASLTFTPANYATPQIVRFQAAQDDDNLNDTATFTLSSSGLTSEAVEVRARDDDGSISLVLSTTTLTLDENATSTFTVALGEMPQSDVTVSVAPTSGDADVSIQSGATLTFTSANWFTPQPVTVAADDDVDVTDDAATLAITADDATARAVTVSVTDDDPAAPLITSSPVTTAVVGAPYVYDAEATGLPAPTFSLSTPPAGMSIDAATGVITWTPASTGSYPVGVVAANGVAPDDEQTFGVEVSADMPPACSLTRPTQGELVAGAASEFFGDGTDDVGTVRAEFSVDGVLGYTDTSTAGHYHFGGAHLHWDTTQYADGPHGVRMTIFDTSGQSCLAEVSVTVANAPPPEPSSDEDAGVADAAVTADAGAVADAAVADAGAGAGSISDAATPGSGAADADVASPNADAATAAGGARRDAQPGDGPTPSESTSPDDGCDCSAPGAPTHPRQAWLLAAAFGLWVRVRRRLSCNARRRAS